MLGSSKVFFFFFCGQDFDFSQLFKKNHKKKIIILTFLTLPLWKRKKKKKGFGTSHSFSVELFEMMNFYSCFIRSQNFQIFNNSEC